MRWGDFRSTRKGNLSHLSDPLGGSLFGFEQLLHGHGLIEMIFGLADLFSGDQKPHRKECIGPGFEDHLVCSDAL